MTKLTDSQLIVLSAAAAREDGLAIVPPKMTKAVAAKVGASLVTRKLMREVRAKPGQPAWSHDGEGRGFCLVITAAGRKAIHVEDEGQPVFAASTGTTKTKSSGKSEGKDTSVKADLSKTSPDAAPTRPKPSNKDTETKAQQKPRAPIATTPSATDPKTSNDVTSPKSITPRENSKQALVIKMLSAKTGVTLDALVEATGWLPHTTRAALTGLRKRGLLIERSKAEGETSVYRIASPDPAVASGQTRARSAKADMQATA